MASAVGLAILVLIVIILAFYLVHYKGLCAKSGFEGLQSGAGSKAYGSGSKSKAHKSKAHFAAVASPCGPGETAVTYQDPDGGGMLTYCRSNNALPGPPTVCGRGWNPAATAEAQALATVGALQHDSYGERKLQKAINAAFDSDLGLSDDQLATLMHQGGTP